jgi:O-antigen ligase
MSTQKQFPVAAVMLLIAIFGIFMLFAFFFMNIDKRWLTVSVILFIGAIIFCFLKEKDIILLKILVLFIPFSVGFLYSVLISSDIIYFFDVVLYVLFLLWFFGSRTKGIYFDWSTIFAVLMIFWSSISVFFAISGVGSGLGIVMLFKAFLVYFYIINRVLKKKQLISIVNLLIIDLAIQGFIGIAQKIKGHALGLYFLGERAVNLTADLARVRGTLGFPNQYAAFLVLIIPMAASFFIFTDKKRKKFFYAVAVILGLLGLLLSLSRSAWIGMACATLVMILLLLKTRKTSSGLLGGVVVIIIIILTIGYGYYDLFAMRLATGGKGFYRIQMIKISLGIIANNPIIGIGLFNYQYHSHLMSNFWHPVHNTYLRLACETGIPGLFFFLGFLFFVLREAYRGLKLKDRLLNAVALGILGGYTAFLIAVMFGPQYQHYRQKFTFWVLAGLALVLKRIRKAEIIRRQRLQMINSNKKSETTTKIVNSAYNN